MAHEIMGKRFISRSKPAWHGISQRIFAEDERITASAAMREVAGDIEVTKSPLFYMLNGVREETSKVAIVRKPTLDSPKPTLLGLAEDSWVATSYTDLATGLDETSARYRVETAGVLKDGGIGFLCFRGEDYDVKGDEMRTYFSANFSLTPGVGHRIVHSPVRVVCWNTNTMSEQQATINLSIPHSEDATKRVQLAGKLVAQFHEMKNNAKAIFEAFADRQVTQKDVDAIIYATFQLPTVPAKIKMLKQNLSEAEAEVFKRALTADLLSDLVKAQETYDKQCENVLAIREAARESFERFNPPNLRGTVWAAYNACTEVSDWREGRSADESAVMGSRAKEKARAFEAAMALVK